MRNGKIDNFIYEPVSIIIPLLNNLDWTKQCLESIDSKSRNRDYEIIIIDNGSNDGTIEYIEEYLRSHKNVTIVKNENNVGVAPAWNQGIKLAKNDYVCVINNDIKILMADWLFELQKVLKSRENIYWVSPRTCYSLDSKKLSFKPSHYEQLIYGSSQTDYVVACCFMCPKKIFNELGYFDEQFEVKYYEDLDYIARILSSGNKVKMCNSSLIYHGVGRTSRITTGGANNESYYQSKWGGTKYDILAMQPGRGVKAIKKFVIDAEKG